MFEQLQTPDTLMFREVKRMLVGGDFPWYWTDFTVKNAEGSVYNNDGFYGHILLARPRWDNIPGPLFSSPQSQWLEKIYPMVEEIVAANPDLNISCVHRINANLVHPGQDTMTPPHLDHQFPHWNMLVYLTDAGGPTILTNESFDPIDSYHPKEDDIVVFQGLHCMIPPKKDRRVVLVVTFS
jgi:hypothetical protein